MCKQRKLYYTSGIDIFDTVLVYLKNTLLVCNTKNIPLNDMNIKNISLATQKHIKKSVWVATRARGRETPRACSRAILDRMIGARNTDSSVVQYPVQ